MYTSPCLYHFVFKKGPTYFFNKTILLSSIKAPGCGKTKLAKAVAGEAQAAFLPVGPSDILSKFVGESEASIRGLFREGEIKMDLVENYSIFHLHL